MLDAPDEKVLFSPLKQSIDGIPAVGPFVLASASEDAIVLKYRASCIRHDQKSGNIPTTGISYLRLNRIIPMKQCHCNILNSSNP